MQWAFKHILVTFALLSIIEAGSRSHTLGLPQAHHGAQTRVASSPSILVNSAQFRVSCPLVWKSTLELSAQIPLSLVITNRGSTPTRYALMDTLQILMSDEAGRPLQVGGGRNRTRPGLSISPVVPPGHSYTLTRTVHLRQHAPDRISLTGDDGFGGVWTVADLRPGKYRLSIKYKVGPDNAAPGHDCWQGTAQTPSVTITVR